MNKDVLSLGGMLLFVTLFWLLSGCQTPEPQTSPESVKKQEKQQSPPDKQVAQSKSTPSQQVAQVKQAGQPQAPQDKQLAGQLKVPETTPVAEGQTTKAQIIRDPGKAKTPEERLHELSQNRSLELQQKLAFVEHLFKTAKTKFANHEYNAAKSFLDEALQLDPTNASIRELRNRVGSVLGERTAQQESLQNAIYEAEQVKIEQAKLEVRNHYKNGLDALKEKDYDHAIREFDTSLEIMKWAPYQLGLDSLRKQIELRIKETQDSRERWSLAQQEEKMKEALKRAEQLEAEEQARQLNQIRILLEKATDYYVKQKYEHAQQMIKRVLELDSANRVAQKLQEDIRSASHSYIAQSTLEKKIQGWKRFLEGIRESAIPTSSLLLYPDKNEWHNVISKRQSKGELGHLGAEKKEDSPSIRHIQEKLDTDKVVWNFVDTPFQDVITHIRTTSYVNIVVDPKVIQNFQAEGTQVTLQLTDLRLKDALNVLLEFYNLKYIFKDDVLYITRTELAKDKTMLALHDIRDLTGQIKDFPGPKIKLQATRGQEASSGALFQETEEKGKQGITTEKLTELIKASIAPDTWDKIGDDFSIAETSGQLVVVHTSKVQAEIRDFLNDMRRFSGLMVAMETRFITATDDFLEHVGVDWRGVNETLNNAAKSIGMPALSKGTEDNAGGTKDNAGITTSVPSAGFFFRENEQSNTGNLRDPVGRSDIRIRTEHDAPSLGNTRLKTTGGMAVQIATLDDAQLSAILWAIKKTSRAEVLMSPRMTAFNTQRASLTVVEQQSYIKDYDVEVAQSAYIADPVIGTVQTGVVLDVRPIISNDRKYITMELRPTVATLNALETFPTTLGSAGKTVNIQFPTVQLQSVESTVRIPDQGSLLIGGLRNFRETDLKYDIPFLGNIPIISFFFSQRTRSDEKEHLMILVTAKIIDLEEEEEKAVGIPK